MLDESIEIDMEALENKKEETSKQKKKLFEGIECENALYIFSKVLISINIYSKIK